LGTARLKIAAYPFQKYGLLEGTVTHMAADANKVDGDREPLAYRALVQLSRQTLDTPAAQALALSAGMLVLAEIHQGERSVLEYLLSPVQRVALEASRERCGRRRSPHEAERSAPAVARSEDRE
jgi:hemolysin D